MIKLNTFQVIKSKIDYFFVKIEFRLSNNKFRIEETDRAKFKLIKNYSL